MGNTNNTKLYAGNGADISEKIVTHALTVPLSSTEQASMKNTTCRALRDFILSQNAVSARADLLDHMYYAPRYRIMASSTNFNFDSCFRNIPEAKDVYRVSEWAHTPTLEKPIIRSVDSGNQTVYTSTHYLVNTYVAKFFTHLCRQQAPFDCTINVLIVPEFDKHVDVKN